MIKIANDKGDDLSEEMLLNMAVMFGLIEGAARMCNITLRKVEAQKMDIKLIRNQKKSFNDAYDSMKRLRYHLNNAFDGAFDAIIRGDADRLDSMGSLGIDLAKLCIMYLSRVDNDYRNKDRIKKKIMAYKGLPDVDVNELLEMYKIR